MHAVRDLCAVEPRRGHLGGGDATVYWNGAELGSLDYTLPLLTDGTMSWVGNPDNNNNPLPTRFVDDLGVWDRVLATWEVEYLAGR